MPRTLDVTVAADSPARPAGRAPLALRVGRLARRAVTTVVAIAAAAGLALSIAAPADAAAKTAWFSSPSGNIGCYMTTSEVRCDILVSTYKKPKKPASCENDYGQALAVTKKGKGHFICVGDTVAGAKSVLKYGKSKKIGRFTCKSTKSGITCTNRKNKHGFSLSKKKYRRF